MVLEYLYVEKVSVLSFVAVFVQILQVNDSVILNGQVIKRIFVEKASKRSAATIVLLCIIIAGLPFACLILSYQCCILAKFKRRERLSSLTKAWSK